MVEYPLPDTVPLLRFADTIRDKDLRSEGGEGLDEWHADYHLLDFGLASDSESDYGSSGSGLESPTPASYCGAGASD